MAVRVYKSGGLIIIEPDVGESQQVPVDSFTYDIVLGDVLSTVHLRYDVIDSVISEETLLLEDEFGATIGNEAAVSAYLDALTATGGGGGPTRDNEVLVKLPSDFPTAVAGLITLVANTLYDINGSINIGTDRILFGQDSVIKGKNKYVDQIISATTGDLFTGDVDALICNVTIECTGVGSNMFVMSNITTDKTFEVSNCILQGSINLGSFTGFRNTIIKSNLVTDNDQGFQFKDGENVTFINNSMYLFTNTAATNFVEISGGTAESFLMEGNFFHPKTNETVFDIDLTATVTELNVIGNSFVGATDGGTYLSVDIDLEDTGYTFKSNRGIDPASDENSNGAYSFEGNTTSLALSTNVWTKIPTTTIAKDLARWTMPVANRLLYIGRRQVLKKIFMSVSAIAAGAQSPNDYQFSIFKNGVRLVNVRTSDTLSGFVDSGSFVTSINPINGDFYEVFVRNIESGQDIIIINLSVAIR